MSRVEARSVSLLIPGYRTTFLRECLDSAIGQSWCKMEILVGDDCPDDGLRAIVDEYAARDSRVRRVTFDGSGGRANMLALFGEARGELIKFLNDDDLLDPDCVERMARCLIEYPDVSLVAAHRRLIDANGARLPDAAVNRRLVACDSVIDARPLVEEILARRLNLLGEPTSTMFRRRDLARSEPDLMSFAGRRAAANGDVSMWVSALQCGDAIYLAKTLSSFRIHDGQRQRAPEFLERGRRGWDQLCADARAAGLMPSQAPAGVRSRPLGIKPWWPAAAREIATQIERRSETGERETLPALAERLVAIVPGDSSAAAIRAMLLIDDDRAPDARELLAVTVEREPWNLECRRTLGLVCLALDDLEGAWRHFGAALEAAPDDLVTHAAIAPLAAAYESQREPHAMLSGALDGPADGVDVCDHVAVQGWAVVHPAGLGTPLEFEIIVDGRPLAVRPRRHPRPDVLETVPQLAPFNPCPGFDVPLVIVDWEPGPHTVECRVRCGEHRLELGRSRFNVLAHAAAEVTR